MSKRQLETSLHGVKYRLNQLGAETCATLGEALAEATALTARGVPATAAALARVRAAVRAESSVLVVDEDDPKRCARWVPLDQVYDDHFAGERAKDHGAWFAWAVKESGIADFLGGAIRAALPHLLAPSPFVSPKAPAGSSTASSSTSA